MDIVNHGFLSLLFLALLYNVIVLKLVFTIVFT